MGIPKVLTFSRDLRAALPLAQLLDAQGYLVAGTFGDILWRAERGQEAENGRLRYSRCPNKAQREGLDCKGHVKMVLPSTALMVPSASPETPSAVQV